MAFDTTTAIHPYMADCLNRFQREFIVTDEQAELCLLILMVRFEMKFTP